jgi:hypothetical protein
MNPSNSCKNSAVLALLQLGSRLDPAPTAITTLMAVMSSLGSADQQEVLHLGAAATTIGTIRVPQVVPRVVPLLGRETVADAARISAMEEILITVVVETTATEVPHRLPQLLEPPRGTRLLRLLLRAWGAMEAILALPLPTFLVTALLLACPHLHQAALPLRLPVPWPLGCRP